MPTSTTCPSPSALTSLVSADSANPSPISALTSQILHDLRHQQLWTNLHIHEPHTLSETQSIPLISGLPPNRVYTHPDEQAYMLENGIRESDAPVEMEWLVPLAQGQKWTLRILAGCFDALPERWSEEGDEEDEKEDSKNKNKKLEEFVALKRKGKWGGKRLLLSVVNRGMGGDGTVVYYVVSEGAVKPRQN